MVRIDPAARTVVLENRREFPYDALLLAVGARAFRPPVPGIERGQVYQVAAVASIGRDRESLVAELALEQTSEHPRNTAEGAS